MFWSQILTYKYALMFFAFLIAIIQYYLYRYYQYYYYYYYYFLLIFFTQLMIGINEYMCVSFFHATKIG